MRFAVASFAILSFFSWTTFAAVNMANLPDCSLLCFQTAIEASGCDTLDTVCQCTTGADKITASLTPCVVKECNMTDLAKVQPASAEICKAVLATVTASATARRVSNTATGVPADTTPSASAQSNTSHSGSQSLRGVGVASAAGFAGLLVGFALM